MTIKEFNYLVDSQKKGTAWVNACEPNGIIRIKYNTASSFLAPFEDLEITSIAAKDKNEFIVKIKDNEN